MGTRASTAPSSAMNKGRIKGKHFSPSTRYEEYLLRHSWQGCLPSLSVQTLSALGGRGREANPNRLLYMHKDAATLE